MNKSVWQKLELDLNKKIMLVNPPEDYWQMVEWPFDEFPEVVEEGADLVHIFTNDFPELIFETMRAKELVKENAGVWVSHYKKSSGEETGLSSDIVRKHCHGIGFTDNKVCSIDKSWTACRFVIPLKDRQ